jgi:23S rRNA (adenine-N6)-dimethyltransferase
MPAYHRGRHEFGQNFLTDKQTIDAIVGLVARTDGRIIEIGCGRGALTRPLERLGRRLTAIEIDQRMARTVRVRSSTEVITTDFLRYRLPGEPHVVVGNLPFHQTTAILRRLLHAPHWTDAVLLVQWEVARRRAAVGGATMMTAQWWPWFEFDLVGRVPASAFTPRPGVDGGILTMTRRDVPLVDPSKRRAYQSFVHRIFTGSQKTLRHNGIHSQTLPRDLTAKDWVRLFGRT